MLNAIREYLKKEFNLPHVDNEKVSYCVHEFIKSPEFSGLYSRWKPPFPDLGLGEHVNHLWRNLMSNLTELMKATAEKINTGKGGATPEQITAAVHGVIDPLVADLQAKIDAINATDADEQSKLGDITAALTEFSSTIAGPAEVPPAPVPEPTPAPTPEPAA